MLLRTTMSVRGVILLIAVAIVAACAVEHDTPDCDPTCQPFTKLPGVGECHEGQCTPTFLECFDKLEFDTCSAMCESAGSVCAENACAGATYLIHENVENCMDPSKEGGLQEHPCDEPVDWQVNSGAQCCCEQP